jgi:protein-S-isoprenylcysteine O-methyltransferase Ste14
MLKLLPPIWALIYVLITAAISYLAGGPRVAGLSFVSLAVSLIVLGIALAGAAAVVF